MKEVKTLIIGAGISGLTYSVNCPTDYIIIEKESEVGGLCRTFYKDGFVWDYAGHFFHFATDEIQTLFKGKVQPKDVVKCNKSTNINYSNIIVDYPFQMNIHQLPKQEFIDCLYDLFNKSEQESYANFEDMLFGKFGKSITEKFLKPYNEKLYACRLNELDTNAMGRFFPYANLKEIINNMKQGNVETYNSFFEYPKKGAMFFINLLKEKIDEKNVFLNSEAQFIDPDTRIAIVNGEKYHFQTLINTIPLNRFLKLLPDKFSTDTDSKFRANKVLVFNIGFDSQANDTKTHWVYFPDKNINFYRIGYYSNILSAGRMSIYVEIGFEENKIVDVDYEYNLTIKNLKQCGIITTQKVVSYNHVIIDPGYVHITQESNKMVERIKKELSKYDIYSIGRYGSWTYCSMEDCMIEALTLAKSRDNREK